MRRAPGDGPAPADPPLGPPGPGEAPEGWGPGSGSGPAPSPPGGRLATVRSSLDWVRALANSEGTPYVGPPVWGIRRRWFMILVVGAAALVAVAIRFDAQRVGGFVTGIWQYDDAVYLGTAVRIVHGVLPYRDFALMGPPGGPLLLTPLAELARVVGTEKALVAARLATPLIAGANVVLLGLLLRRRAPLVAAVACFALALYPDGILGTLTFLLEPPLEFFCLLGAVLLFDGDDFARSRGRVLLAGVAFGLAGAVKAWAILPVLVVVVLCLPQVRRRLIPFSAGVAGGFLAVCGPFLVAAPRAFVAQVIFAQLGRGGPVQVTRVARLQFLSGLWTGIGVGVQTPHLLRLTAIVCVAIAVTVVAAFLLVSPRAGTAPAAVPGRRAPHLSPLERFALAAAVVVLAGLMWPPEFWYHYASFFGPFLALVLGLSAGRIGRLLPLPAVAIAVLVLAAAAHHAAGIPRSLPAVPNAAPQIAAATAGVPAGACVVTDDPEFTIMANRFTASSPHCPPVVDSLAATLVVSHDGTSPRADARAAAVWLGYFRQARYLMLSRASSVRIAWTPQLQRYVYRHFELVTNQPWMILKRVSSPPAHAPRYHVPPPLLP